MKKGELTLKNRPISAPWLTMLQDEVKVLKAEKGRLETRITEIDGRLKSLYAGAVRVFD